jgi:oligopeptide/dipeptide ABC transporter ATP-binding protein
LSQPVLSVRGLRTSFRTAQGMLPAVDGVDLDLYAGETLGIVGESGCGKTVTALSILRLIPEPPGKIRGRRIAMIFQEPMTSLNPVFRVGDQIEEVLTVHTDMERGARRNRVAELLELVGVPAPEERSRDYPHQLSGGLRQRIMIAMALACNPDVLIADEPTTALDVTIQAQILELLESLKQRFNMAVMLITHDLGVVAEVAQRVAVLYAGRVVETGSVVEIFRSPSHPYTRGLMRAMPGPRSKPRQPLHVIPGVVPDLVDRPSGCSFRDRCERAISLCTSSDPALGMVTGGQAVACHNPEPREASA